MLSEQQIAEGWLPHDGGSCPVAGFGVVEALSAFGIIGWVFTKYRGWKWPPESTYGYRIVAYKPEPKP